MKNSLNRGYLYRRRSIVIALSLLDLLLDFVSTRKKEKLCLSKSELKKILIVKPDHLGDAVLMSSVLSFLSRTVPTCQIDYVTGPWNREIVESSSAINRIWYLRHFQTNRSGNLFRRLWLFASDCFDVIPKIAAQQYDLVLFMRAFGGNLVFLSPFLGARLTAGHATAGGRRFLDKIAEWKFNVHELEHYREVLVAAGFEIAPGELKPRIEVVARTSTVTLDMPTKYVCLHPGAGQASKQLSPAAWARALEETNFPIVVCGTKAEQRWVGLLSTALNREVLDRTNLHDLTDLIFIFSNAEAVHSLDSFASHYAAAIGANHVTVHVLPSSDVVQWRPIGEQVEISLHPVSDALVIQTSV